MIEISVIIPYFKKKNYIKKTINSIVSQSFKNFEIILIYDDSDLSDLEYIKKILKKNKKSKILVNKKNLGVGKSRNLGIKKSRGKYCAFIDADDLWLKNKLKYQLKFMKDNKLNFTFTPYIKKFKTRKKKIKQINNKLNYEDVLSNCSIGLSTVIIKKSSIKGNLFIENLKTHEDYGAWLKILKKSEKYAYCFNKPLTIWNDVSGSLSKNSYQKICDLLFVIDKQKIGLIKTITTFYKIILNSLKRKF